MVKTVFPNPSLCNLLASELAANFFHPVSIEECGRIRDYPLLRYQFQRGCSPSFIFGSVQPGNRDRHENDRFIRQPVSNNTVFVFPDGGFRVRLHLDNLVCLELATPVAKTCDAGGGALRS